MQLEPSRAKMLQEKFWLGPSRAKINCTKSQLEPKRANIIYRKLTEMSQNFDKIAKIQIKIFCMHRFHFFYVKKVSSFWLAEPRANDNLARAKTSQQQHSSAEPKKTAEPCRARKIRLEPSQNKLARGSFQP